MQAEIAATADSRATGLMHRPRLPDDQGMLFIFDEPGRQCMWMKNTLIPLTVAFIDEAGHILNLADMAPNSPQIHCSTGPARYALETNQGWFGQRGLRAGVRVEGIPGR